MYVYVIKLQVLHTLYVCTSVNFIWLAIHVCTNILVRQLTYAISYYYTIKCAQRHSVAAVPHST